MCIEHLSILLNQPSLLTNWHSYYGLTQNRADALVHAGKNANSLHHPGSETALTLFTFGNLDGWHQIGRCNPTPRDNSSKWSSDFFSLVRENKFTLSEPRSTNNGLTAILASALHTAIPDLSNAVLMFEFEVLNSAFHPECSGGKKAFKNLSFLSMGQGEWSQFDALLIAPSGQRGTIVFIEAKLTSDVSRSTTAFPLVNQLVRNLESAYLLTHHDDSLYKGWDFHYIFVCPRTAMEYKTTYYAYALGNRGDNVSESIRCYGRLLEKEYQDRRSGAVYEKHFEEFENITPERVHVLYWDECAAQCVERNCQFWTEYLSAIERLGPTIRKAVEDRLKVAGIRLE